MTQKDIHEKGVGVDVGMNKIPKIPKIPKTLVPTQFPKP